MLDAVAVELDTVPTVTVTAEVLVSTVLVADTLTVIADC